MTGLVTMAILIGLLGLLAVRFGVDSRDGQDWHQRPGQWRPAHRPARRASVPWTVRRVAPRGSSRPRSVGGAA